MLASYQLCFLVFVTAQLRESLSHSTGEEHFLDRFSSDTRCGWDCIITESDFSKGCDPVFTKTRLVKFNVIYDLFVNSKCLNQTSYKPNRMELSLTTILYGYRQIIRLIAFLTELKACGIFYLIALRKEKSEDFAT